MSSATEQRRAERSSRYRADTVPERPPSRSPIVYHERTRRRTGGSHVSETVRQVSDHPLKKSFDTTPSDLALRSEDGWVDMDVRWLLTRETVGAQHSVFGITVFPPGS